MSLNGNNILAGASGQTTGYDIEQSLRFNNADTPYLSWTPSSTATSTKICTISCWIKRGQINQERRIFTATQAGSTPRTEFTFNTNDYLVIGLNPTGGGWYQANTTALYRDPSAWYHIVWALDTSQATASNRSALYVNGEQVTDFSSNTLNDSTAVPQDSAILMGQSGMLQVVGAYANILGQSAYDGYMAEFHFVDGQKLTPASFGETNEDTNQWQAIEYEGSYGTNGFYLKFQDSSALGDDSSGNTNDFTPTNLAATDQVLDSPTNNFATLNPLDPSSNQTLSEGNLKQVTSGQGISKGTMQIPSSGKWYWEVCQTDTDQLVIGFAKPTATLSNYLGSDANGWGYGGYSGVIYNNGGSSAYGNTYTNGDIVGVAFDADNQAVYFSKNNTWQNSGDPTSGSSKTGAAVTSLTDEYSPASGSQNSSGVYNFGQDSSFAGNKTSGAAGSDFYYTPPTGFKALSTDNLSDPSIADPTAHFNTVTYSGNASTRSITGVGFQPDFIWGKQRNGTNAHALVDSVRGNTKYLSSQRTNAEDTQTDVVTSFDSDGFSLGASVGFDMNQSGSNLVAWNWKAGGTASSNTDGSIASSVSANTDAGFSIVSWTGDTSSATIGHGLSQAPELIIIKSRDGPTGSYNWPSYSKPTGTGGYINLDQSNAWTINSGFYGTAPTASVFSPGSHSYVSGAFDFIAYCFHGVDGYSKVGSYTGSGSSDGPFVYTGFRPAFVMVKSSNATASWWMGDTARETYNGGAGTYGWLQANASDAEADYTAIDHLSNGFKLRDVHGGLNGSGNTYLYLAFAESPFKYSNAR